MVCNNCNHILPDDSEFCQFCGNKLQFEKITNTIDISKEEHIVNAICNENDNNNILKKHSDLKTRYCKKCGGEIKFDTKQCSLCGRQYFSFKKVIPIVLSVIIIILVALNVIQFFGNKSIKAKYTKINGTISEQKSTITSQKEKIERLENEINELSVNEFITKNKLEFFDEHVAIVCDDGTKKYHTYDCDDCDLSTFWLYNTEAAEVNGYYACPKCH